MRPKRDAACGSARHPRPVHVKDGITWDQIWYRMPYHGSANGHRAATGTGS